MSGIGFRCRRALGCMRFAPWPPEGEPLPIRIGYARLSVYDQPGDLDRQVEWPEPFCAANGWRLEVLRDEGSGLHYHKQGLGELIRRICSADVARLVVTSQDRLLRFGSELVFSLCAHFGTEVVLIINASEEATFEEELAQDLLEIITVFSARLYESRKRKNRDIMKTLKEAADAIRPENASGSG